MAILFFNFGLFRSFQLNAVIGLDGINRTSVIQDYLTTSMQVVQPLRYFRPTALLDSSEQPSIVEILQMAVASGNVVKAAGSGHSYSDVATTPDYFIDNHSFNKVSSASDPITGQLSQAMLRSDLQLAIDTINWPDYNPEQNKALIEFEAGITLHDLNNIISKRNVGLANMGGYDGQTMMGAISTSTHGSGISLPPFPDMLQSLVLATTGKWNGQVFNEKAADGGVYLYRIEPANGITDPTKYSDPNIQLIQDDDCFNSVICSMGCMGGVYSVVIEVMQMYWLEENRYETTFDKVIEMLTSQNGEIPDKLNEIRNFEVLVHPYPMNGLEVIEMDPTVDPSTYYSNFKCLVTERNIVANPGGIFDRKGHRNAISQFAGSLACTHRLLAKILNAFPRIVPPIINTALSSLVDTNYINKYWKIYTLGLEEHTGFATEIGFSLEDANGNFTHKNFEAAVNKIHMIAQDARVNGLQYQTSPFSLRFVKASNAYLSMIEGVNTCMIEMDMVTNTYGGMEIMKRYQENMYALGGRPHWGLEFDHLTGSNGLIGSMYSKLDQWMDVYNQFNSEGTFNNNFTDRVGFSKKEFKR